MINKWDYVKFGNLFDYEKKSKIKAGEGMQFGKYPFYTSSLELSKYLNDFTYDKPSLIFGTGGNASVHYCESHFSVSTDCLVAFPKDSKKVDVKYVYYYLYGNINILEEGFKGAGLKHISKEYINEIEIPLPTLSIQNAIVKILNTANDLKINDENILMKYNELAHALFYKMFGDPIKNEMCWPKTILKSVTTKIGSGSTPTGGKVAYKSSGISLIRSMNIYDFAFKWKDLAYIDDVQATKLKNVEVKAKDVLFNITGASVCRCSIVPDHVLPARVNQHVAILRANPEILNPVFLNHLLVSNSVKASLLKVGSSGGAVMEAITKEKLENFEIILPTIDIQNNFEKAINLVFDGKNNQIENLSHSNTLFNSLIQKAFNGELIA